MTTKDFQTKKPAAIFFSYFRPHIKLFVLDMSCALFVALVDLAFPFVSRVMLNDLLPNHMYRALFTVLIVLVAAYAVRSAFHFIITYWGHFFGIRVEADMRRDLFYHMQELPFSFYDRNITGKLMSRLTTDLFDITELAHHGPEDIFISSLTILGALAIMFAIEWRLAIVVAAVLVIAIVITLNRRRAMGRASAMVKARQAAINGEIESSLSGVRTAKAFAAEAAERAKFDASNEEFKTSKKLFHREMGKFQMSMEFFLCILSVAVIGVGSLLAMRGEMDYVDILAFTLYIAAFTTPLRKLANFAEIFANGAAGFGRFIEIMRIEPDLCDAPDAAELKNVRGEINAEHVNFSYNGGDLGVLHDVSIHIAPGEMIAIVGPSGGGKTTFCQLVPRFYDVTGGSISVDGHDVRSVTQKSLRDNIGVVRQDVFLFSGSVRDNIRYGKPDATDAEIEAAARRAEIYDDIMAMPNGFDTNVGERGVLLSGGQKQRISIARVFLKDPPIIILDEATSALDSITEARIQESFSALARGRTSIVIAHRLSTVRSADRIIVMDGGAVREQGTHEELMALGGEYADMCRTQSLADGQ